MRTTAEPLYIQIAEEMRHNIRIGKWSEGKKIPTEFELCDVFHVSRITIRKAVEELVRENLLTRKKAVGTFVKHRKLLDDSQNYTIVKSFTKEMLELGIRIETLKVNVIVSHADYTIANFLKISPGEKIIILKRLRGIKNKPIGYFITYFKYEEFFSLDINNYKESFYEYLNSLGINITNNSEVVEAILPTKEISSILKVSSSTPILRRCRFTSDAHNHFYEYTECYYIGSEYKYFIDFTA
ncbi:GntR family transcriptional regulator [Enterococcus sp. JM9B]|uniref:GntR family transcriptional regulator n=1 Tax=Enterococcus sp. JM9B TaxID=1857216 RepID=UPI001375045A|nr:GntR family transcriptional regulator [Enterococcus sp. JM9B]KAF1300878.1 GntR family transcriptional regulator [Enterococcus sp. JM9B]